MIINEMYDKQLEEIANTFSLQGLASNFDKKVGMFSREDITGIIIENGKITGQERVIK